MTVSYRNRFTSYKQETDGQYAPVGSIVSVLVDNFSDAAQSPEYGYKNYLYCDGRELNIRDYPFLYRSVGNTYGGSPAVERTQPTQAGGVTKLYWINGKAFFNLLQDGSIAGGLKLPYPYGVNFRILDSGNGRGALDATNFPYDTFFSTQAPTEDVSAQLPGDGTEYAYEIIFPTTITPTPGATIVFSSGTHPNISFRKNFSEDDYPFQVGTFRLPDYRDKVIVGYGAVDGEGSPTVENALINNVGQSGGRWYISRDDLLDGGVFFTVGNVRTTGYTNINSDVFTFITGSVTYQLGPIDDYIFSRPVEHFHYILSSEPDEGLEAEFGSTPSDQYAVLYNKSRANVAPFEPQGSGGLALGHSHGISAEPLNDPRMATYGNVSGIGGEDPNVPIDVNYDVNDSILTNTAVYSGVSLELYGSGSGEIGGFAAPAVTDKGDRYLAFGYGSSGTFGNTLQTNRSVTYTMDFTGYTQLYIFAICGNDSNGGERPNNTGEGLQVTIGGVSQEIIPSGQDFNAQNGIESGSGFDAYDAVYAYWTQSFINIPAANQTTGQTVTISQTCTNAGGGNELQSGNEASANALDMFGIQAIGLRGGIPETPPDANGTYPVTGSPLVTITSLVYDSANGYVVAGTAAPHNFDSGMIVTVSGAVPDEFNGAVEVLPDQLSSVNFTYVPESAPSPTTATGTITARIASGSFSDVTETPAPRVYVINNNTVVGGKPDVFEVPGTGVIFFDEYITSPDTINASPVATGPGESFSQITVNLVAPGGGGAGSFGDGGDAGYAYATFNWKGTNKTIYAYGGDGGQRGNNGGAGGSGGTFLIPADLLVDPDFQYTATNGIDGQSGGGAGSDTASTSGGGQANAYGSGGDGNSTSFLTQEAGTWEYFYSSGTWSAPSPSTGETSRNVQVQIAGAGGGGGNPNFNSGCSSGIGGTGGGGALVTATLSQQPSTLSYVLGTGGSAGFNNKDGNTGTGSEAGVGPGGTGASPGGYGGQGAWGNGATAGGGGGSSGVYFNGGTAFLGAGGGGGGGGSGGGYNGGGTTDGCYSGGNNRAADTNLHAQNSAIDFNGGGNGTSSGCTSGGGGGGGGGAGPTSVASGGAAGQAGVGHNGNGGGTGGKRGDSTYRTNYCTATWSTASNGGSPGSAGGGGYFAVKVDRTILNYGAVGGGGGQGASLNFNLIGENIAVTAGLQSPGTGSTSGGDSAQGGENGYVQVTYYGSEGGGEVTGETTTPAGNYYEANAVGVPGGSLFDGGIWVSSSADGDIEADELTPVNPGLGTGTNTRFAMPSGAGVPTYGGLATKYLPFNGPGNREYVLGPLDLTNANKLRFVMIKGTNLNGGAAPEEGILAYWRVTGSTTTNLLDTVITANDGTVGWGEFDLIISEGSDIRQNNIEIILRQTRPAGNDDNTTNTEDNYGMSAFAVFYDDVTTRVFTPSEGQTISDVDEIVTTVSASAAGLISTDGFFEMSSSTPISTTALVSPENDISLVTKYHRVKYLIKAT